MDILIILTAGLGALNLLGLLYVLRLAQKTTLLYEEWQCEVEEFAEDMEALEDRQGELEQKLETLLPKKKAQENKIKETFIKTSLFNLDLPKDGKMDADKIHEAFEEMMKRRWWKG